MPAKTVLIVDRDLGFVFWLGQNLDSSGYDALPAKGIEDAIALLGQLRVEVDLLILNPLLDGAVAMAEAIRRSQGHLRIMTILSEEEDSIAAFQGADASKHKPSFLDESSRADWLEEIDRVLGVKALRAQQSVE